VSKIKKVIGREILDSRGFPTVEVDVTLDDGSFGRAAVPSGASTGTHEALELRDGGTRYLGKGVQKAVKNVEKLAAKVIGADSVIKADEIMLAADGTPNKTKMGANAILGVSMASCRAFAASKKLDLYDYIRKAYSLKYKDYILPTPMLNIVNGGKHADSGIDVQEFMIVPVGAAKFSDAMRKSCEIYQNLKKLLASKGYTVSVGDEGGFAPKISRHDDVLKTIMAAVAAAGYSEKDVNISLDSAASEFFNEGRYTFEGKKLDAMKMAAIYEKWAATYPIASFEDPLSEDDWDGWKRLTLDLGERIQLVGDDIFVTNPDILAEGIDQGVANSILIKLNQIGSVTETVKVIEAAHKAGYSTMISHRSGETEDSFIADLAVATNAGAIKTGAPCRSERLAKYNQLLRIEGKLGAKAKYAKKMAFKI